MSDTLCRAEDKCCAPSPCDDCLWISERPMSADTDAQHLTPARTTAYKPRRRAVRSAFRAVFDRLFVVQRIENAGL
jgi:hypothetical protein